MADHNIDRLFREGFEQAQPSWDERYWQDAEAALDRRKKRRRRFFLLWFAGLIVLAIGMVFWFTILQSDPVVVAESQPATENPSAIESTDLPVTEGKQDQRPKTKDQIANTVPLKPAVSATTDLSDSDTPQDQRPKTRDRSELTVPLNPSVSAPTDLPETESSEVEKLKTKDHSERTVLSEPSVFAPTDLPGTESEASEDQRPKTKDLVAIVSPLQVLTFGPQGTYASAGVAPELILRGAPEFHYGLGVSLLAQSGVPRSWNTPWWAGWSVHGLAAWEMPTGWGVRLEPGLLNYRGNFSVLGQSVQRTYGLALTETTYALVPEDLYYLQMPVQLTRRIGNRHHLSGGAEAAWLLGAYGRMETYEYLPPEERTAAQADAFEAQWRAAREGAVDVEPMFSALTATQTGWLAKDGLRRFTFACRLGYELDLGPQLRLSVLGRYRLTGFGQNRELTSPESRISLELGINYWIR